MAKPLKLLFAGTPEFARVHLEALLGSPHEIAAVLTQPDRPSGRGKKARPSPVKALAESARLPVMQPSSLKSDEAVAPLAALAPDLMVVVAYGLILPQAVLDLPRLGCVNVHASLLPRWRGAAPIQRAVEAGDPVSGVTIMGMDAGLDTGPMLNRVSLPLTAQETGGSLHDRLAQIGPPALLESLADIETSLRNAEVQDNEAASYAHKIEKAETQLQWEQDAERLERKIRAFHPAPGCSSFLGDARVKIHAAACLTGAGTGSPGEILETHRDGVIVACGTNALRITRAQLPGGKALDVADLLNGKSELFAPGNRFGSGPS